MAESKGAARFATGRHDRGRDPDRRLTVHQERGGPDVVRSSDQFEKGSMLYGMTAL